MILNFIGDLEKLFELNLAGNFALFWAFSVTVMVTVICKQWMDYSTLLWSVVVAYIKRYDEIDIIVESLGVKQKFTLRYFIKRNLALFISSVLVPFCIVICIWVGILHNAVIHSNYAAKLIFGVYYLLLMFYVLIITVSLFKRRLNEMLDKPL